MCNTVYEEVCEAAQPTYGGGRGGHGGASGGYGAAKAPACRQVLVDLMVTYSQFTILLRFAFTKSLLSPGSPSGVQERAEASLHKRPPASLQLRPKTEVPQRPHQEVRQRPQTGNQDDREDINVGKSGGLSNSWHSENMFCSQVAREDCQTVPVQKCDSVKDEQCRNVPRQVLRGRN